MKNLKTVLLSWGLLLTGFVTLAVICVYTARNVILSFGVSEAEGNMLSSANKVTTDILKSNDIEYENLAIISRDKDNNITGIEMNTPLLDFIKCSIHEKILANSASNLYSFNMPLGTLVAGGYFGGLGPSVPFKVLYSKSIKIDFVNDFTDCGINNVLHRIVIKMTLSGNIILLGKSKSYNATTSIIAAQTVIVGKVPQSFTNVTGNLSDAEDSLFKYREK